MKTQRLISSYDEINDIFCGKIDGKMVILQIMQ